MGIEYDWEIRGEAERLYVEESLSFKEISSRMDVPIQTLHRWSQVDGLYSGEGERRTWSVKRKAFHQDRLKINANFREMMKNALEKASKGDDSRLIMAAISVLREDRERQGGVQSKSAEVDRVRMFMESVEFLLKYLKGNDKHAFQKVSKHLKGLTDAFKKSEET